jgi:hypothetical protein
MKIFNETSFLSSEADLSNLTAEISFEEIDTRNKDRENLISE